jgi:hypothetical protein
MDLYSTAIRNSEKPDDLEERIEKIKEYFRLVYIAILVGVCSKKIG